MGNLKATDKLEDLGVDGVIINMDLRIRGEGVQFGSVQEHVAGTCEHGKKTRRIS